MCAQRFSGSCGVAFQRSLEQRLVLGGGLAGGLPAYGGYLNAYYSGTGGGGKPRGYNPGYSAPGPAAPTTTAPTSIANGPVYGASPPTTIGGVTFTGKSLTGTRVGFVTSLAQAVKAAGGTQIVVISAKRPPGPGNDVSDSNHITGNAIDGYALINGKQVPLGTLLRVENSFGPDRAMRYNAFPAADLNGAAAPGFSSGQAQAAIERIAKDVLPHGITFEWTDLTYQEILAMVGVASSSPSSAFLMWLTERTAPQAVVDLFAAGVPLRTPALLGAAIFHGLREPAALVVTMPLVLQYTVIHGAAFVLFGLAAAGMLALADREPRLLFAFVMLLCCFEVFFAAMVAILAEWLLEAVPLWTILAGNLLAALVMMGYFLRGHRVTWHEFIHARR